MSSHPRQGRYTCLVAAWKLRRQKHLRHIFFLCSSPSQQKTCQSQAHTWSDYHTNLLHPPHSGNMCLPRQSRLTRSLPKEKPHHPTHVFISNLCKHAGKHHSHVTTFTTTNRNGFSPPIHKNMGYINTAHSVLSECLLSSQPSRKAFPENLAREREEAIIYYRGTVQEEIVSHKRRATTTEQRRNTHLRILYLRRFVGVFASGDESGGG